MAHPKPTPARHTAQHLIVETISTESLAGSVIPTIKRGGVTVLSLGHLQIMRYVYTLVEAQQLEFEGRALSRMPGLREAVAELVRPGQQIVSRPTGRFSVLHAYTGKKNVFQPKLLQNEMGRIPLGYIDLLGEDPAPRAALYGREDVRFVSKGGEANPIAAAFFNARTRHLQLIQDPDPATLLSRFAARAPKRDIPVG